MKIDFLLIADAEAYKKLLNLHLKIHSPIEKNEKIESFEKTHNVNYGSVLNHSLNQNNFSENAILKLNFGDAYLIYHNPLFRQIRLKSHELGLTYDLEYNNDYNVLSLSQLENIMTTQKLPYFDNVSILKSLNLKMNRDLYWDDVVDNLKKNYVFHESCHFVARQFFNEALNLSPHLNEKELILAAYLQESFANTCECLANSYVLDKTHREFFEANSYILFFEDSKSFKLVIETFGFTQVFKFFLLHYLLSNTLKEQCNEQDLQIILTLSELDKNRHPQHFKLLKRLASLAFELNPRFREVTTRYYLRSLNFKTQFNDVPQINFLNLLKNHSGLLNFFQKLTQMIQV